MKISKILPSLILVFLFVFISFAQDSTSLKLPTKVYLKDMPTPKVQKAGIPKTTYFPNNKAQGKRFFTSYDTDNGLALDLINYDFKSKS